MVPAVLNNRSIWQKYVKLSLLKKWFQNKWPIVRRGAPAASRSKVIRYRLNEEGEKNIDGQNHTCKFPCMWLVRDNFFGFAWTSGPIWGCSLQHERTFSELVRNGATRPARIQPGSISHVPFPTILPCLGASLACREKARLRKKSVSSLWEYVRCVHRRGKSNASCSAGLAWSGSVAWPTELGLNFLGVWMEGKPAY